MNTLTLIMELSPCAEYDTTQNSDCTDNGSAPTDGPVQVICTDMMGNILYTEVAVDAGDKITVSPNGGLPDEVSCSILSTSGPWLQTVVINTS